MSEHEQDLLIYGLSILLVIFLGTFLGSQLLDASLLVVLFSALKSAGWRLAFFGLLGLLGLNYELTTISRNLQIIEAKYGKNSGKSPLDHRAAIGSSIGVVLLGLLLTICAYSLGNKESVLKLSYILIVGGIGFLLLIVMMFVGAVIARIRR